MNETLQMIKDRRSIRKYREDQIPEESLQEIVEAGLFAPSGNNQQSWHFTVVQDKGLLRELNNETKTVLAESDNPFLRKVGSDETLDIFNGAPTVIIVSGKTDVPSSEVNCAMASENMMIAAQALHISSCYIDSLSHLFDGEEGEYFRKKIGIPGAYKVYNAVLLGYGDTTVASQAAPRREGTVNYIR